MRLAIALAFALAACHHDAPAPTTDPQQENAQMMGSVSPTGQKHPGQIAFHDKIENRDWTEDAAKTPQDIAWVKAESGYKPVVEIEITGAGDMRESKSYGPNHEFLSSNMGHVGPLPSTPDQPVPVIEPTPDK